MPNLDWKQFKFGFFVLSSTRDYDFIFGITVTLVFKFRIIVDSHFLTTQTFFGGYESFDKRLFRRINLCCMLLKKKIKNPHTTQNAF